ncbi:hypothetical protein [Spirosoma sordidisoli]|uniref:Uncharacterized protein n=1 Tax=Spirosoma sordidisoli TaxID=2502893 RepID=A0A4Q2UH56_9BACT|nr:hypothetical protein [Spirosoma sordidisoli]RYC66630.1 hypothetical protein EQG79_28990 [Spirosoma sordidisoli]
MRTDSGIKNVVTFRLTGTPDGNLLVRFYHLDIASQEAVNWHIAEQLVAGQMSAEVLYEGNLQNNTVYPTAIYKLLDRVEVYVNCVRIERVK